MGCIPFNESRPRSEKVLLEISGVFSGLGHPVPLLLPHTSSCASPLIFSDESKSALFFGTAYEIYSPSPGFSPCQVPLPIKRYCNVTGTAVAVLYLFSGARPVVRRCAGIMAYMRAFLPSASLPWLPNSTHVRASAASQTSSEHRHFPIPILLSAEPNLFESAPFSFFAHPRLRDGVRLRGFQPFPLGPSASTLLLVWSPSLRTTFTPT